MVLLQFHISNSILVISYPYVSNVTHDGLHVSFMLCLSILTKHVGRTGPTPLWAVTPNDLDRLWVLQEEALDLLAIVVRQLGKFLDLEWVPGVVRVCRKADNVAVLVVRAVLDELDVEMPLPGIIALIYRMSMSACLETKTN
jgi:hypothetical protein